MADPATEFRPAGLNIPYQFTPTHYTPQYVNVPSQAGELWARAGETALKGAQEVFTSLMNSPLNPTVREQFNEARQRAIFGQGLIRHAQENKKWGYAVGSEGPQGASMVAPASVPVAQQGAQNLDWNKEDGGGGGGGGGSSQPATITRKTSNTGVDEKGQIYHENTPGSNQWIPGPVPPPPPTNLNTGMWQGGLVRDPRRFYAQEGGVVPPRQFLNPATGSYDPLQREAPPAPGPPPPAQQPQPQNQAIASDQGGAAGPSPQALAAWQAANAHPVISPQAFLKAYKENVSTTASGVTYSQTGGVNGEPLLIVHNKEGGDAPITISQVAKTPWGRALIQRQNPTETLEHQDNQAQAASQPQAQTPMTPSPGMFAGQGQIPAQSPMTPSPGMFAGQGQQGPPAAPGGTPRYGDVPGQPQDISGQIAALTRDPRNLMASDQPAGNPATTATTLPEAKPMPEAHDAHIDPDKAKQMEADDPNAAHPIFDWKPEKDANGDTHYYAIVGAGSVPFTEQRYYKGTGLKEGYFTGDNWQKAQLFNELGGAQGVPIPKDPTTGKPVANFDQATIASSTPEWRALWLNYIRDFKLHPDAPLSTSPEGVALVNAANAVKDAERIKDKILYLKQNHGPMSTISQSELIRSQEAGYQAAANNPAEWALWYGMTGGGPKNNFADELGDDFKKFNQHASAVPGGTYGYAKTPETEKWPFEIPIPTTSMKLGFEMPRTTNVSTVDALNKIGSGDNYDQALGHAQEVLGNAIGDYKKVVAKLGPAHYRPPDEDLKNLSDLADPKKGYLEDSNNKITKDANGNLVNGYGPIPYRSNPWFNMHWTTVGEKPSTEPIASATPGATPGAKPSPTPAGPSAKPTPETVPNADYEAAKKVIGRENAKPGGLYTDPADNQVKRRPKE